MVSVVPELEAKLSCADIEGVTYFELQQEIYAQTRNFTYLMLILSTHTRCRLLVRRGSGLGHCGVSLFVQVPL